MTSKRVMGIGTLIALGSCAMAVVFVRTPALWPLMPTWLGDGLMVVFKVKSQERASEIEFLSAWLLCLTLCVAIVAAASVVRRSVLGNS